MTRNGREIGASLLGTPFPVDFGDHVVQASAPGYKTWSTTVKVQGDRAAVTVDVPALQPDAGGGGGDSGGGGGGGVRKPVGLAVLGVGAAGLIAGAVTAGLAASKRSSLLQQCPSGHCLQSQEPALGGDVSTMNTMAGISTATFIGGGVLAAGGLLVVLTAPRAQPTAAGLTPMVGPGFVGLKGKF